MDNAFVSGHIGFCVPGALGTWAPEAQEGLFGPFLAPEGVVCSRALWDAFAEAGVGHACKYPPLYTYQDAPANIPT